MTLELSVAADASPAAREGARRASGSADAWQREMERAQAAAWFLGALPALPAHKPVEAGIDPTRAVKRAQAAPARRPEHLARPNHPRDADGIDATVAPHPKGSPADRAGAAPQSRQRTAETASPPSALDPGAAVGDAGHTRSARPPARTEVDTPGAVPGSARVLPWGSAARSSSPVPLGADASVAVTEPGRPRVPASDLAMQVPLSAAAGTAVHLQPRVTPSLNEPAGVATTPGASSNGAPATVAAPTAGYARVSAAAASMAGAPALVISPLPAQAAAAPTQAAPSPPAHAARAAATVAPSLLDVLGLPGAPRLHLSWHGDAVMVWLGVDVVPDTAMLVSVVQRVLRQQGIQLAGLVCNGRTLVASPARSAADLDHLIDHS